MSTDPGTMRIPATVDVEQIVASALHSDDEWGGLHTAEDDIRAAAKRYVGRRVVAEMPVTPRGRFAPEDIKPASLGDRVDAGRLDPEVPQ